MMNMKLFLLAILATTAFTSPIPEVFLHPDVGLDTLQLIEKHGYPVERHQNLETEDGYILEMQRIPHGINNAGETNKPPVLLMHGLTSSSADWVNAGPGHSFAYALADVGYDVWLGNARGNAWSRKHKTLTPKHNPKEFWNFSWNEIGTLDLPVMIDHILAVNGADKLFYTGHSQGTTSFFVLMSEKPEYNKKIRLMNAFAPVAYMHNVHCPLCHRVVQFEENIEWLSEFIGIYEFVPKSELFEVLGKQICEETTPFSPVCASVISIIFGHDPEQLNNALIPVILSNIPSGSSTKQFLHYMQTMKSKSFGKYDFHSDKENIEMYGQPTPPNYNISNIVAPVALHYGQNDVLASVTDVQNLRDMLKNVAMDNKIVYDKFNHFDFLWAIDAFDLLYNDVIELMQKY